MTSTCYGPRHDSKKGKWEILCHKLLSNFSNWKFGVETLLVDFGVRNCVEQEKNSIEKKEE